MSPGKKKMPASPTSIPRGQVRWFPTSAGGEWRARIRFALSTSNAPTPGGKQHEPPRKWVTMPTIAEGDADGAMKEAARLALKVKREAWTLERGTDGAETAKGWFRRWLAYLREIGQATRQYGSNFDNWIEPEIGSLMMTKVSSDDLRRLVAKLNDAIDAREIRWKHAANVWGTVSSAFRKYAGPRGDRSNGLQVRDDDPTRDVAPPKKGPKTEKLFLYPAEFLKLVTCERVPLRRRRAWALAVYMYLRPGESEALCWPDIDRDNETYTIRRGVDRERGNALKPPKNRTARSTADLEEALVPLIHAMAKKADLSGRLVGVLAHPTSIARTLRRDLLRADVTRYELHHRSKPGEPAREAMEAHDLRTTGITWMAARGDDLLTIVARAGHHDIETTRHYVQKAALLRRTFLRQTVFPALPACLLDGDDAEEAAAEADGEEDADDAEVSTPPPSPAGKPAGKRARIDKKHREIAETHGNRTHRPPREGRTHPF